VTSPTTTSTTPLTFKRRHVASYRSGLEERTADWLRSEGIDAAYECPSSVIRYIKPEKPSRYTPDFVLPNGIVIETKGVFSSEDRAKHLLIREQFPDIDIRFVFSNPNQRIGKDSKTTYAMWCEGRNRKRYTFLYAKAPTTAQSRNGAPYIPLDWIDE